MEDYTIRIYVEDKHDGAAGPFETIDAANAYIADRVQRAEDARLYRDGCIADAKARISQ